MMQDLGVNLQQQGVEVKAKGSGDGVDSPSLEIKLDATAGRAIAMRRGAGRIRHIATPTTMNRHLNFCGMRFAEGRSRIAPQLEHLSTIDSEGH